MSPEARRGDLIYGCMRICGDGSQDSEKRGMAALRAAIESGYRRFDHADIYGGGRCETLFGDLLRESPSLRERVEITSKCGVRFAGDPCPDSPKRYDLSKEHIVRSVEGSLRRLRIDALDTLLLHRPDYLFAAEEVCEAFARLRDSGKVRCFGVSNFSASQVVRLQAVCPYKLVVNQVEVSLHDLSAFENGILDQCRQLRMTPEAWSPLRGVTYAPAKGSLEADAPARIRAELETQAEKYGCESWVVVLAWLLAHPAGIAPLVGTVRPQRIRAARRALELGYDREDWYRLLEARRGCEVP